MIVPLENTTITPNTSAALPSTTTAEGSLVHRFFYKATGSPIFWILIFLGLSAFPWVRAFLRANPPLVAPEVYGTLPEFSFTSELGGPFGTKQLKGKVWVANFIFTNCQSICPLLTKKMLALRLRLRNLKGMCHLVSFTVDPVRDTPEVLKTYAQDYGYDKKMWSFVTGPLEQLEDIIINSFKSAIARPEDDPSLFEIAHGERFVLVDYRGQIRGFYKVSGNLLPNGQEDEIENEKQFNRLLHDISMVVNHY